MATALSLNVLYERLTGKPRIHQDIICPDPGSKGVMDHPYGSLWFVEDSIPAAFITGIAPVILNSKKKDTAFSKNTYYRFLNEPRYNWKRFLTLLAVRVTEYFNSLTKPDRAVSLVLDDTIIPRERSRKVELLSRVYDHVIHRIASRRLL